jgi:hypothetical protein
VADQFQRLIDKVREFHPSVLAVAGTGTIDRNIIRASLALGLPHLTDDEKALMLDLNHRPSLPDWSISVSHSPVYGGWVAIERPWQIGFDLESLPRIQPATVARIAAPDEIAASPDTRFLWSAKEAYFKALETYQPLTISELKIGEWELKGENFWTYRGYGEHPGQGYLCVYGELLIALSLVHP